MNRRLMCVARMLMLAMLSLVVACSSSSEDEMPRLSISADGIDLSGSALNFQQSAASVKVGVSSNSQWRVSCSATWVEATPAEGSGNGSFRVAVSKSSVSRSAVVTVSLIGNDNIRHSFDVIQRVSQTLPDTPNTEPNQPSESEDNPDEGQDSPNDGDDGMGDDDDNNNPDDGTTTPPDEPTPPEDDEDTPPADEQGDYSLIDELDELEEGRYYIGGYQKEVLHLATGGLTSVNHCKTAVFEFGDDGSLMSDENAAEVILEAAEEENGYYIRFANDGYLTAKASGAGKLQFSSEKSEYWLFSAHEEGGFVLRQSGDIDVKLIISQNASSDILRSISGDEDANAVIFLKINHPE